MARVSDPGPSAGEGASVFAARSDGSADVACARSPGSLYSESAPGAIRNYQQVIKSDPPPGNAAVLEAAREYNERLSRGDLAIEVGSNRPELLGEVVTRGVQSLGEEPG